MSQIPQSCVPCEDPSQAVLLSVDTINLYLAELKAWELSGDGKIIFKKFTFKDFVHAMSFVEQVADVAEELGHHPDIHISYNKLKLELTTHSVEALTQNDFVVASRIDGLWLL